MALNLHERWLLFRVGVRGRRRRALFRALTADGQRGGDVDVTAQLGGYQLAPRAVRDDLTTWFDRLLLPGQRIAHVVYGHRTYRRTVILAAALGQAGISAQQYSTGRSAGATRLTDFSTRPND